MRVSGVGRAAVASAVGALMLAAAAPGASAAQRYAAPSGSGNVCTAAQPCTLGKALNGAAAGDEVIVGPGVYGPSNATLASSAPNLNVHGVFGQPRPTIQSTHTPYGLTLLGAGSELRWVTVHDTAATALLFGGQLAEQVVANAGTHGTGCVLQATVLMRDSVCVSAQGAGLLANGVNSSANSITLRNVTALGTGDSGIGIAARSGNSSGQGVSVSVVNTIARGTTTDISVVQGGQPARVATSHSSFDPAHSSTHGGGSLADDGTTELAAPFFTSGYREAINSPTVDAGVFDFANGGADVDGDPRSIGLATDIGADERTLSPTVQTGGPSFVSSSAATVLGSLNANGVDTHYHYEYGRSVPYGQRTPAVDAGAGANTQSVPVTLSGLTPRTTYHFRLVAANAIGTTFGDDRVLTTPAASTSGAHGHRVQCIVPRLGGLTKTAATRRLRAAHCRRGRVYVRRTHRRSRRRTRLVVLAQSSRPGARLGVGTRISFLLGPPRHKRRRHHHR